MELINFCGRVCRIAKCSSNENHRVNQLWLSLTLLASIRVILTHAYQSLRTYSPSPPSLCALFPIFELLPAHFPVSIVNESMSRILDCSMDPESNQNHIYMKRSKLLLKCHRFCDCIAFPFYRFIYDYVSVHQQRQKCQQQQ